MDITGQLHTARSSTFFTVSRATVRTKGRISNGWSVPPGRMGGASRHGQWGDHGCPEPDGFRECTLEILQLSPKGRAY